MAPTKQYPSTERLAAVDDPDEQRLILVGAEDVLPPQHFWYETDDYSIYAAEQPASSWRQHSHECAQITIGLEPAHVQATWDPTSSANPSGKREITGNLVSIIPPGEPHSTVWQRRAVLIHLYISRKILAEIAAELRESSSPELRPVYLGRDIFIEELGRTLFRESRAPGFSKTIADSIVTVLIAYLLRNYSTETEPAAIVPGSLGPSRERRIRDYIEASLDQDLSIAALAANIGMNPKYFASAFRLTTGFTPHRYVTLRRVDQAQRLLASPALTLAEIAYQCGFKSQGQFTTLFRQITGETPGKFRKRV